MSLRARGGEGGGEDLFVSEASSDDSPSICDYQIKHQGVPAHSNEWALPVEDQSPLSPAGIFLKEFAKTREGDEKPLFFLQGPAKG